VAPDLWGTIKSETSFTSGEKISEEDLTYFSDDEKTRIRMSINEFRLLLLKKFEPTKDELKVIDDRLDYLLKAVDRLNKIDWKSIAIATILNISVALTLDPEKTNQLVELFRQAFSNFLQLMQ